MNGTTCKHAPTNGATLRLLVVDNNSADVGVMRRSLRRVTSWKSELSHVAHSGAGDSVIEGTGIRLRLP